MANVEIVTRKLKKDVLVKDVVLVAKDVLSMIRNSRVGIVYNARTRLQKTALIRCVVHVVMEMINALCMGLRQIQTTIVVTMAQKNAKNVTKRPN